MVVAAPAPPPPVPGPNENNGDEEEFETRIGNYHKGLPHNQFGEVDAAAYNSFLKAVTSQKDEDFEAITLGLGRKLTSPQAGLAKDTEGPDPAEIEGFPPAPKVKSEEAAAEAVELYWMALLRDVQFTAFASDSNVQAACAELSTLTDFTGPKDANGLVIPANLFRGTYLALTYRSFCSSRSRTGPSPLANSRRRWPRERTI